MFCLIGDQSSVSSLALDHPHMTAHTTEDVVGNCPAPACVVVCGDAVAEQNDLVANASGEVGDVHHCEVHGDAANHRSKLAADPDPAVVEAGGGLTTQACC